MHLGVKACFIKHLGQNRNIRGRINTDIQNEKSNVLSERLSSEILFYNFVFQHCLHTTQRLLGYVSILFDDFSTTNRYSYPVIFTTL